jgi:hypothetical protein
LSFGNAKSNFISLANVHKLNYKSKYKDIYLLAFEFTPTLVMKFRVEMLKDLEIDEINKAIANIAIILNKSIFTLISHGRYRKS